MSDGERVAQLSPEMIERSGFEHRVWRFLLSNKQKKVYKTDELVL
jgi:hypothetical protein